MKRLLATLALALVATVAGPNPAAAQSNSFFDVFTEISGVTIPIDGFTRARRPGFQGGCRNQISVEFVGEASYDSFSDLLVSSFNEVVIRFRLPNGSLAAIRLFGVTLLGIEPAVVNGQKGWSGTFCYDRQVLEFGGQELE